MRPDPSEFSRKLENGQYQLTADVRWCFKLPDFDPGITVPKGFCFDISVPKRLRWLVRVDDPALLLAAAVHDWMLRENYKRNRAAIEFYEAAIFCGKPRWKAFSLGAGVLAWTTWLGRGR